MKKLVNQRWRLLISIEKVLEGPMIFLGFVWLILLFLELVWGLLKPLQYASVTIWIIFIIDFLIKFILAPEKIPFFKRNWLTIISLIIPALRVFRIFRVFRLLRGLRGIRLVRIVSSLNRSIKSLAATMERRAFGYVMVLTLLVAFGGAAGMFAYENPNPGFDSYSMALWWTAMTIITSGNEFSPATPEGRSLGFLIAVFGFSIFGYVTATLASFFIGRDAEEENTPVAGSDQIIELKQSILLLTKKIDELKSEKDN